MEKISAKRAIDYPTKICQYGRNCYRKNPVHFGEFKHTHLESIIQTHFEGEFTIPDEYSAKSLIREQVEIVVKLFPHLIMQPQRKIPKRENSGNLHEHEANEILSLPQDKVPQCVVTSEKVTVKLENETIEILDDEPGCSWHASASPVEECVGNITGIGAVLPVGRMEKKLRAAAPYNFFLTSVPDSRATHSEILTITFQEILDKSLGDLECSLQINYMVDIDWILMHYDLAGYADTSLMILYGEENPELENITKKKPNVVGMRISMAGGFGIHHTKMMLLGYKDGSMRVVVSSANLYPDDWNNRTQGIWMSPKLPGIKDATDTATGESPTHFREDLMRYLLAYNNPTIESWINRVQQSDFTQVNVFLVASVPGKHRKTPMGPLWGHPRVGYVLSQHCASVEEPCSLVAQSSSIGNLGDGLQPWVRTEWGMSFRKDCESPRIKDFPQFHMIYPSLRNVSNSHDGIIGGACLPYGSFTNDKQFWLKDYFHQWKANRRFRTQAMPHIKTYSRWSDRGIYYFLLTSCNMSKAAWGMYTKSSQIEPPLRILNYEVGVLFLPKFITKQETFPFEDQGDTKGFPLPYDVPLTPYGIDDVPFLMDYLMETLKK